LAKKRQQPVEPETIVPLEPEVVVVPQTINQERDPFGRRHGLMTPEYMAFLKKGEILPIMKEIRRRPDLSDTYDTVLELLLADEEIDLPPLDLIRVALHTMRELQLITWEFRHEDIGTLPESHPKLANAIQRAVAQMDSLKQEYRRKAQQGGLFEQMGRHMTSLKLEVQFEEQGHDSDLQKIKDAFKTTEDEKDE
jgi:hypothetical protein